MDARDFTIVRGLIAVAWADGRVTAEEHEIVDALLEAYKATPSEAAELRRFAVTPRGLQDIDVGQLSFDDRRVLLQHAVLLTFVDGQQHDKEKRLPADLIADLNLSPLDAERVVRAAEGRACEMLGQLAP